MAGREEEGGALVRADAQLGGDCMALAGCSLAGHTCRDAGQRGVGAVAVVWQFICLAVKLARTCLLPRHSCSKGVHLRDHVGEGAGEGGRGRNPPRSILFHF